MQWSLRVNSGLHRALLTPRPSASALAADQEAIARRFASRVADRLGVELIEAANTPPLIRHALAHFVCRKVNDYRVGDHELFVGEVLGHDA